MSNKSEATWHPNSGPEVPHADLEAITARVLVGDEIDGLVVQETEQGDWMLTDPAYDDWIVILRTQTAAEFVAHAREDLLSLLAALGDTVPRKLYDQLFHQRQQALEWLEEWGNTLAQVEGVEEAIPDLREVFAR